MCLSAHRVTRIFCSALNIVLMKHFSCACCSFCCFWAICFKRMRSVWGRASAPRRFAFAVLQPWRKTSRSFTKPSAVSLVHCSPQCGSRATSWERVLVPPPPTPMVLHRVSGDARTASHIGTPAACCCERGRTNATTVSSVGSLFATTTKSKQEEENEESKPLVEGHHLAVELV